MNKVTSVYNKTPKKQTDGDLVSDCCDSDFDPLGFPRDDVWDEKCLKCGKKCDVYWKEEKPNLIVGSYDIKIDVKLPKYGGRFTLD